MPIHRACIAIVDAAHARIYTYQQVSDEDPSPRLREEQNLVNAGRQAHGLFSDKPPRAPGLPLHRGSKDDHRSDNLANMELRFAKIVVEEVDRLVRERAYGHVILVASPKMLGNLRDVGGALRKHDLVLDELPQDLAWLTSTQVHDHLASLKLIAPRRRLPPVRGARASR